jgi:hypothetical protein
MASWRKFALFQNLQDGCRIDAWENGRLLLLNMEMWQSSLRRGADHRVSGGMLDHRVSGGALDYRNPQVVVEVPSRFESWCAAMSGDRSGFHATEDSRIAYVTIHYVYMPMAQKLELRTEYSCGNSVTS